MKQSFSSLIALAMLGKAILMMEEIEEGLTLL